MAGTRRQIIEPPVEARNLRMPGRERPTRRFGYWRARWTQSCPPGAGPAALAGALRYRFLLYPFMRQRGRMDAIFFLGERGMTSGTTSQLTQLLKAAGQGDKAAAGKVWGMVYDRLHSIAQGLLSRGPPACSLQPTSMIGAVWERVDLSDIDWSDRDHFFAIATKLMHRLIAEEARRRKAKKRDGGRALLPLRDEPTAPDEGLLRTLAVAEALEKLERMDPRGAQVVRLRYIQGLSIDETAAELGVSPRTVDNIWKRVRVWLHHELSKGSGTWCGKASRK